MHPRLLSHLDRRAVLRLIVVTLFLVTVGAFARAVICDFINYDDYVYVIENDQVRAGLNWAGVRWAFTTIHTGYWHPLTWLSLMLDTTLWGVTPAGYHATNVLIHALNAVLVFLLLRRLTAATGLSLAAAGLWALHPLRVESVAWVSERKDVLCVLFGLLSLLAYERYARTPAQDRQRWRWSLATWGLMAVSLCTKPMLVTLPCVMLLLDAWPLGRMPRAAAPSTAWRAGAALVLEKWPGWLLTLGISIAAFIAQQVTGSLATTRMISLGGRLGVALHAYLMYLVKTLWPRDLAILHVLRVPDERHILLAALTLALVSVVLVVIRRRVAAAPAALMGWCWFLGTLAPVIGIIQTGPQAFADRYTYFPSIGLWLGIVWLVASAASAVARRLSAPAQARTDAALVLSALALATAAVLVVQTWRQLAVWQSPLTLWPHTLRITGINAMAHSNMGPPLMAQGRWVEAREHLITSIEQDPKHFHGYANLMILNGRLGREDLAEAACADALALRPTDAQMHQRMAMFLVRKGPAQFGRALDHYRQAVRLKPADADMRCALALLLFEVGQPAQGWEELNATLRLNPSHPEALAHLGLLMLNAGRLNDAILKLRQALLAKPDHLPARKNLGMALAGARQYREAIAQFQIAAESDPGDGMVQLFLGVAHLDAGDPASALPALRQATRLMPAAAPAYGQRARAAAALKLHDEAQQCLRVAAQLEAAQRQGPLPSAPPPGPAPR